MVVMDQFTRRIIGFGVQAVALDGPALCRMFNQAISGRALPTLLSTDHDPLFQFHRWQANLRILARLSLLERVFAFFEGPACEFPRKTAGLFSKRCLVQTYPLPRVRPDAIGLKPGYGQTFSAVSSPVQKRQGPLQLEHRRKGTHPSRLGAATLALPWGDQ